MANHHTRQIPKLTADDRRELEYWTRNSATDESLALRARIVLGSAAGRSDSALAEELGSTRATVGKWRRRFLARGMEGLLDKPRPGAPRRVGDDDVERVVQETLEAQRLGSKHLSTRSIAARYGLSPSTVWRIWQDFALQPHREEMFQLCEEPLFAPKVRDIMGLYLHPPERAVVLCVAEQLQAEATNPTQPMSSIPPDFPECRTDDQGERRSSSLITALEDATVQLITRWSKRHRAVDFRKFLNGIGTAVPAGLEFHLVLDNFGTHKAAMIHDWLEAYPRFHLHITATSSAWVRQVKRWFADLPEQQIRHGTPRNTHELEEAIEEFLAVQNQNPQPFIWTKSAERIVNSFEN